jgi:hypothetical protein|tara:strand:+ start:91 stop:270 length:180 start_codon:yes stop_codon:yes gene_type:complete
MSSFAERTMTVRDNFAKGVNHSKHVAGYRKSATVSHAFFPNSVVPDTYKTSPPQAKSIF